MGFKFRWCKEARDEYERALQRPDAPFIKAAVLSAWERLRTGRRLDLARAHLPIRSAPAQAESEWSMLYAGDDGDYVGLLFIECAVDELPQSAYELAKERLANLQF